MGTNGTECPVTINVCQPYQSPLDDPLPPSALAQSGATSTAIPIMKPQSVRRILHISAFLLRIHASKTARRRRSQGRCPHTRRELDPLSLASGAVGPPQDSPAAWLRSARAQKAVLCNEVF